MSGRVDRRDFLKLGAGGVLGTLAGPLAFAQGDTGVQLIVRNARISTMDGGNPDAQALAVSRGRFVAVGRDADIMKLAAASTTVIDAAGRRVIPGLHDGHTHPIRGGLNYNMELRWDGVPSLADAMRMLREQAQRTPPPQWVRVVGGFTEYQFPEKRLPTLAEINAAAPNTPVFILRLYDRAMLNRAALRAVGYTKDSQPPPAGVIERDASGEPTGLLLAKPNAAILYSTLARGPKLSLEDQMNSSRQFMRELNRLGVTSVIDAGGGFQNYPQDYEVIERLARANLLTLRFGYNLFPQKAGGELADFQSWAKQVKPGQGSDMYRHNGGGEMLVYTAADFEDFREPRPELPAAMEGELERVTRFLAENGWPFRLHATYDETISRALDVFEKVNRDVPIDKLHWFFDHAETITPRNIDRVKALGGGIAVQHRMMYQGEDFVQRYGTGLVEDAPPVKRILEAGVPIGAGTDATRVASYNPWISLYWLVSGRTIGGTPLYPESKRLDRATALRLWTVANAWFSNEEGKKGTIKVGQLADFAVLSDDYMTVPEERIKSIVSLLTVVGGDVVHGDGSFAKLAPPLPPASPDWSPVARYGGYYRGGQAKTSSSACSAGGACAVHGTSAHAWLADTPTSDAKAFWGAFGCSCWMA